MLKILIILDVIKYCDHPRWYEKIPPGGGTSDWRWGPPIGGDTSNWRWDLHSEVTPLIGVGPLIGGEASNQRWDLQSEVTPPIGGETSNQRWDLLEVGPLIGGGLCMLGHTGAPMLHVGISYSFEKKRDYLLLITSSRHLSTR